MVYFCFYFFFGKYDDMNQYEVFILVCVLFVEVFFIWVLEEFVEVEVILDFELLDMRC